ncbi:MAG: helix-turn-helix transcriptional regulator [Candidatus Kerfeldbacteria bacterium]|nr:helix-turn-helix transcriptional regulator [Candidatus Kerfeldbacteria bacterium]
MQCQMTPRDSKHEPRYPNAIREYRLAAGLGQGQLGAAVGRSRATVSGWERGLSFPRGIVLLRLAKRLNTLAESLYYDIYAAEQYFD